MIGVAYGKGEIHKKCVCASPLMQIDKERFKVHIGLDFGVYSYIASVEFLNFLDKVQNISKSFTVKRSNLTPRCMSALPLRKRLGL